MNGSLNTLMDSIPRHVHITLLEEGVGYIAEQLVDAYAHIKKCNDEGRALMARDCKVLQAALDNLLRRNLLPPAKLSLVHADKYVAALSMSPEALLAWAKENAVNSTYSMRHLTAIVMAVGVAASTGMKKKEQQDLVTGLQQVVSGGL